MSNNPNTTHQIFSSRINNQLAGTYIGESGRMFYHEDTGELRLSDGITPGGLPIISAPSGNISLIGDITAFGTTGSNIITTLSIVNSNIGSFGNAAYVPIITVNSKGLITAITSIPFSGGTSTAVLLDGDMTASGYTGSNTTVTLNTVNSNIGEFGDSGNVSQITVNSKGLVTSVSNVSINFPIQVYPGTGIPNSNGSAWLSSYSTNGTGNVVLDTSPTFTQDININGNLYIQGNTIESLSYEVPNTGDTINISLENTVIDPAATIAELTINLPAPISNGHIIRVSVTQIITALTITATSGSLGNGQPTTIGPGQGISWIYNLSTTTWYRLY